MHKLDFDITHMNGLSVLIDKKKGIFLWKIYIDTVLTKKYVYDTNIYKKCTYMIRVIIIIGGKETCQSLRMTQKRC